MTQLSVNRVRWSFALLIALVACGDNLIRDPSFELWCGDGLCAPWEHEGEVTRVGTWHDDDYGIALGDDAEVSQLSEHGPVECIEFQVIADVEASAQVSLEMDFLDDGTPDYRQAIPESHWSRLTFLVTAPTWYDRVRFRIRKAGHGRAVLAQILATPGDECEDEPIALAERPLGAKCEQAEQCTSGTCAMTDPLGTVCGECEIRDDCEDDGVCVAQVVDGRVARVCIPLEDALDDHGELGALCGDGVQCDSGVCCGGVCSECCIGQTDACEEGASCGHAEVQWVVAMPALCDPGSGTRESGQACNYDADCASEKCVLAEVGCLNDTDDHEADADECSFLTSVAGRCQ